MDIKSKILNFIFLKYHSQALLQQIINHKQRNFKTIKKYKDLLQQLIQKYAITISARVKHRKILLKQHFKIGLEIDTKTYPKPCGITNVEGTMKSFFNRRNNLNEIFKRYRKDLMQQERKNTIKYFSYNKTYIHNTKECKATQKIMKEDKDVTMNVLVTIVSGGNHCCGK